MSNLVASQPIAATSPVSELTLTSKTKPTKLVLTDKQYAILLDLFHEYNETFKKLPMETNRAFYDRLYER